MIGGVGEGGLGCVGGGLWVGVLLWPDVADVVAFGAVVLRGGFVSFGGCGFGDWCCEWEIGGE